MNLNIVQVFSTGLIVRIKLAQTKQIILFSVLLLVTLDCRAALNLMTVSYYKISVRRAKDIDSILSKKPAKGSM